MKHLLRGRFSEGTKLGGFWLVLYTLFATVKGHSILETARALGVNGPLEEAGKRLDLYYISTRYPDAFPSGAPFEFFTKPQADEAYDLALRVIEFVSHEVGT